jgi:hypothetical protein
MQPTGCSQLTAKRKLVAMRRHVGVLSESERIVAATWHGSVRKACQTIPYNAGFSAGGNCSNSERAPPFETPATRHLHMARAPNNRVHPHDGL